MKGPTLRETPTILRRRGRPDVIVERRAIPSPSRREARQRPSSVRRPHHTLVDEFGPLLPVARDLARILGPEPVRFAAVLYQAGEFQ